jgi:hypothetical protein
VLANAAFQRHPAVYSGAWAPRLSSWALAPAAIERGLGGGHSGGQPERRPEDPSRYSAFADHVEAAVGRAGMDLTRFAAAPQGAHFAAPGTAEFDFAAEFRQLQQLEAVEARRLRQCQLERRAQLVRALAGSVDALRPIPMCVIGVLNG